MPDEPLREPEDIRRDCVRKIQSVETSGMFSAILGCLLEENWTTPPIDGLYITPDGMLLARAEGEATHKLFLGAEADLIRNIHGIADVAGLDGDEKGYLLGKVAEVMRIEQ